MLKESKQKKSTLLRAGVFGLVLAIASVVGGLGFGSGIVTAQEQSYYCEEKNGQFVQQKEPCIAKKILECKPGQPKDPCADPAIFDTCKGIGCNMLVKKYVEPGIKVLVALVGIVVAISITVAAIMYGSAGSDPGKVAAAKKRFASAVLALLAYLFTFAFLQWLLPGGIL